MKQEELITLLQQPSPITEGQTIALQEVLKKHPYFQVARALLLKGLKNQSSLHYNKELKVTAAHSLDRGVLFDYISSAEFNQNAVSNSIKQHTQKERTTSESPNTETSDSLTLDAALRMKLKESEHVFDPEIFSPFEPGYKPHPDKAPTGNTSSNSKETLSRETSTKKLSGTQQEELQESSTKASSEPALEKTTRTDTDKKEENLTADTKEGETLNLGQPLSFAKEESHSFSEWLRLTKVNPINKEEEPVKKPESQSRKFKLIDQFISRSPRIIPSKSAPKPNLTEMEQSAPDALMTETLARVYLEQKNYKKAIQAYKILILKNPEKSGFFADQIRAIKKLQEHNS